MFWNHFQNLVLCNSRFYCKIILVWMPFNGVNFFSVVISNAWFSTHVKLTAITIELYKFSTPNRHQSQLGPFFVWFLFRKFFLHWVLKLNAKSWLIFYRIVFFLKKRKRCNDSILILILISSRPDSVWVREKKATLTVKYMMYSLSPYLPKNWLLICWHFKVITVLSKRLKAENCSCDFLSHIPVCLV